LASLKLRGGTYPSDPVKQCCGVSTRAHAMGQMHAVCGWHVPGMSWHAPGMHLACALLASLGVQGTLILVLAPPGLIPSASESWG